MAFNQSTRSPIVGSASRTNAKGTAQLAEVLVFVDDQKEAPSVLEFAALVAADNGARLKGVFAEPAPVYTAAETFARGALIPEVIKSHALHLKNVEERLRSLFEEVVHRHRILQSEWRSLPYWSSEVAKYAYYADVLVIGRPMIRQVSQRTGLAETLILNSGRPVILVPPGAAVSRARRILVGWKETREAVRALEQAVPLLARADSVEVLIVDDNHRQGGNRQGLGSQVASHLTYHGVRVEVKLVSSEKDDIGDILLSEAVEFGADLLVMGAYGHFELHEWVFGGVTRLVLSQAHLAVLMCR